MPPFELRHLRAFVAVAEELHFGRAAARLGMAQPPLSQQIQRLEARLGTQLFHRSRRGVSLTPSGSVLVNEARSLLRHAGHVADAVRQAEHGDAGTIRLGFVGSAAHEVIPRLVRRLRQQAPGITIEPDELATTEQVAGLADGSLDVGLVRLPLDAPDLELLPLLTEPLVVVVSDLNPLAKRRRLSLPELAEERFVLWARRQNPTFHDAVMAACRDAGFRPQVAQEAGEMATIIGLVAAGLGISLVPASMERARNEGVVFIPLQGRSVDIALALAWNRAARSALVDTVLATARELWPDEGPAKRRTTRREPDTRPAISPGQMD